MQQSAFLQISISKKYTTLERTQTMLLLIKIFDAIASLHVFSKLGFIFICVESRVFFPECAFNDIDWEYCYESRRNDAKQNFKPLSMSSDVASRTEPDFITSVDIAIETYYKI